MAGTWVVIWATVARSLPSDRVYQKSFYIFTENRLGFTENPKKTNTFINFLLITVVSANN